jgi:peptidoglycan/xylan/chitin deacetylase (PgdA/CDA1 family)
MNYVDSYKALREYKPATGRDRLRKLVLDGVVAGYRLRHNYSKIFSCPRIQFLYIHHVFADEEEKLARLMDVLSKDHHFISYSEAVRRILTGDIDMPYITISSDDGLRNNLRAARVLEKYGVSGCFFICPSVIGERDFDRIAEFTANRLHFPPVEFLDWDEVASLQRRGHEIGGHTMSHINIGKTEGRELEDEIADCYSILAARCGKTDHFAYPYGRYTDFTLKGRKLVYASGFTSCSSAQRGCHIVKKGQRLQPDDLLIRRDHVVLDWPLEHILYFIARNALTASPANNFYDPICE